MLNLFGRFIEASPPFFRGWYGDSPGIGRYSSPTRDPPRASGVAVERISLSRRSSRGARVAWFCIYIAVLDVSFALRPLFRGCFGDGPGLERYSNPIRETPSPPRSPMYWLLLDYWSTCGVKSGVSFVYLAFSDVSLAPRPPFQGMFWRWPRVMALFESHTERRSIVSFFHYLRRDRSLTS